MRILAVGDVIGSPGRTYLKENLAKIKEEFNIDFTIVNGENSSGGLGMNPKAFSELLDAGANAITLGNHTWRKKDILCKQNEKTHRRSAASRQTQRSLSANSRTRSNEKTQALCSIPTNSRTTANKIPPAA